MPQALPTIVLQLPAASAVPGEDGAAPQDATSTEAQGGPSGTSAAPSSPMAWMQPLLLFGLLFLFMWFMVIRPERRRQKERAAMLGAIRKGDEVTTTAGIYGKVAALGEDTITLDVADGVRLKFERNAIARIRSSRDADDSSDSARKEPEKGKLVSAGK